MTNITISSLNESLDFIELIKRNPDFYYPWKVNNDFKLRYKSRQHLAELAVKCNWLSIEKENQLKPTERGIALINENNKRVANRNQLYDIVHICKPIWASNLLRGRVESMQFVPDSIIDIFITVGLYDPDQFQYDDEAILWWDKIATAYYLFKDEYNTKIGRIGEKLTMHYELKRTNIKPKWKAIESDRLGYDILSRISKRDTDSFCIEVKTSQSKNKFMFTKNEKNFANLKESRNYGLYFWRIYNEDKAVLMILKKEDIINNLPEYTEISTWESCEFDLDKFLNKNKIKTLTLKPADIGLNKFGFEK